MKHSMLGAAASAALAALFASIPALAADKYVMKIGMATINDSNHVSATWIQEELKRTTNGRIEVKVFPAAQLGMIPRQIEGIQLGTQEAFMGPPGFFVGIDQNFMISDTPGLFDSIAHQYRAMNHSPFREKFLGMGESKGFVNWAFNLQNAAASAADPGLIHIALMFAIVIGLSSVIVCKQKGKKMEKVRAVPFEEPEVLAQL